DYKEIAVEGASGRIHAANGYCQAQLASYSDALIANELAAARGFATAAVYNNLGFCRLKAERTAERFAIGREWLNQAIALDDRLQAAYLNRACVELRQSLRWPGELMLRAPGDVRTAVELGPVSAELYVEAAKIYAAAAQMKGRSRSVF